MPGNREMEVQIEQQLLSYYGVMPRAEFLTSLRNDLLTRDSAFVHTARPQRVPLFVSRKLVLGLLGLLAVLIAFYLTTPTGKALAQQILHFFTPAASDTLPPQIQMVTTPDSMGTATPDPASILDANLTVEEAERLAGYNVLEPAWLPESLTFTGATFDAESNTARVFYSLFESNGLVIRQQPLADAEECELCTEVGASAKIENVQIGETTGEYVAGVWKLTSEGAVWESTPYLKRLRWQTGNMTFELMSMTQPDRLTKKELIKIAQSLK